jgi:translation initiation factor IF-2
MGGEQGGVVAVLIKADVQGSAEALREALTKLSTDEVQVKLIAAGSAASPSRTCSWRRLRALIIGFNVRGFRRARCGQGDRRRGALLQHHL